MRALDKTKTGNELPFLIVRFNDWVDVVAERARDAVRRRLDQAWARELGEPDPVIRYDALRGACESFDDETLAPIVDAAAGDAFMPIRRRALEASIERYSELAVSRARDVRAACEVVQANPSLVDYETVRTLTDQAPFRHSRMQALRLASSLGKWANLQLLLDGATTSDPVVGAEVRRLVGQWLATANARSTAPTPRQLASISELLNRDSPWLDARTREWLRGFLSPWT